MDEPHADVSLLRKASFTFWLLGALMLLAALLVGFALFGPNPLIVISKATTHITTPLDANGLPDYAAVLLADGRQGVTPENNGAVPFLMAMWPGEKESDDDEYSEGYTAEDTKLLCKELGLPGIPPIELRVTPLHSDKNRLAVLRLLRERLPEPANLSPVETEKELTEADLNGKGFGSMEMGGYGRMGLMTDEEFFTLPEEEAALDGRVINFLDDCEPVRRVWTAEELPFLAEWLEANNGALDLIVEGAERSGWHLPEPGLLHGGSGAAVGCISFDNIQQLRSAARRLTTRGCFYQGKGQQDKSKQDALAILRLSHHTSRGPFYIDQLVAVAIGGIGLSAVDRIVADKAIPAKMLRSLLKEFDSIGPFSRVAYTVDRGERFFGLDSVVRSSTTNSLSAIGLPDELSVISCDWNPTLRALNNCQDAYVAAAKLPTWKGRRAALAQITATTVATQPPSTAREWFALLTASGRGKALASGMVDALVSNAKSVFHAEDRSLTRRQLTRLGIALAIHRAEQGAYPGSLAELVPHIMQKLPVDLFHKNPFVYRRTNDGYLLYSPGANGVDDGGSLSDMIWGSQKLKGIEVEEPEYDGGIASDWDENGEYIGGSMSDEGAEDIDDPLAKIPIGADDMSLRVPLPKPEPWPWEDGKQKP